MAFTQAVGQLRARYSHKGLSASEEAAIEAIALAAVSRAQSEGRVEFAA